MEMTLLIVVIILLLIILLVLLLRKTPQQTGVAEKLAVLQVDVKEDFRINRTENASLFKEARTEQAQNLKEFRQEMTDTFKSIILQNQRALEQVNATLEARIDSLIAKSEQINNTNREMLGANLKDFSLLQREKSDELKREVQTLSEKTILQLETTTAKIEAKLKSITDQNRDDSTAARESFTTGIKGFQEVFEKNVAAFNEMQREKFAVLEDKQNKLVESTEKKLEEMRATVDEKLQKTLNERLALSFDSVGKQLESVQKGLGEMQTLAQDVGGLKRVLSNVKMRGGLGEVQLSLLLEQLLAPDQYAANVKTKSSSVDHVEFAIKLPGQDEPGSVVWLPIDAKFPKDVYENLQSAYDTADPVQVEEAQKIFDIAIRRMARSISDKYIDPPATTDFAIMFLPFESIYSEVVRKASLLEDLQRNHKVIVTGPTTLAAILNSLQMGFRTLVIQRRSSEVWKVLGAVKKEFENFGGMLEKAQKNLQTASNQIDEVMGKRTRAIQRSLKGVEMPDDVATGPVLPDTGTTDPADEEE